MTRDAAWRRWLDAALTLVGLDELAVFGRHPPQAGTVQLPAPRDMRPEQVNVGTPPERRRSAR